MPKLCVDKNGKPIVPKGRQMARSYYDAAKFSPSLNDWIGSLGSDASADYVLFSSYERLRARHQEMARNDPHTRQFIRLAQDNIIGSAPMRLENCARTRQGRLDEKTNRIVERAWERWQLPENCTVTGDMHWHDVERLCISACVTDGFPVIRLVRGVDNEFGFSIALISSEHLRTDLVDARSADGNQVRMGVEIDRMGKPVAYHLRSGHPNDLIIWQGKMAPTERVPAEDIIMPFVRERIGQTIGNPWLSAALINLRHLGKYQEAAVVAKRAAACKLTVLQWNGEQVLATEDATEGEDDGWNGVTVDLEPGSMPKMPLGYEAKDIEFDGGTDDIGNFTKAILRGVAAAVGVSYNALASDLEGVNFSSLRQGNARERDMWRGLQHWWGYAFERPIFKEFYRMANLTDTLGLPPTKSATACVPKFRGRGWESVDPLKEITALEKAVNLRVDSRTDAIQRNGLDRSELFERIAEEEEEMETLGILAEDIAPAVEMEDDDDDGGDEDQ